MLDGDVILAKVAIIERCLTRIDKVTGARSASLDDLDVQDIFVINLQRATQAAIDIANHLVAQQALGLPSTLKEGFTLLEKAGHIAPDLAERLRRMVGFRNVAVHDYRAIDVNILKAILQRGLQGLREFCHVVTQPFRIAT